MAFPSQTLISRSASVLELEYDKTSVVDLAVGYKWDNIQTAKEDAKAWVMDKGESYKVKKSDQKRLILECLAADTYRSKRTRVETVAGIEAKELLSGQRSK